MGSFTFKMLSAFLSIPFIYLYYWAFQQPHLNFFGAPYPLNWIMYSYLIGLFLHMSYYTTEETEVRFCGKKTGIVLEHGWIVLANLFHFTVSLLGGFALVFGLYVPSEERAQHRGRTNVDVFADQRHNKYNVNMSVGPIAGQMMRAGDNLSIWIFKTPHLIPMRLGFLIMWVMFALSMVHAGFNYAGGKTVQAVNTVVQETSSALGLPQSSSKTITGRVVRLNIGPMPPIPEQKGFIPAEDGTPRIAEMEGTSTLYFFYTKPTPPDFISRLVVEKPLCSMVAKGMKIFYWTKSPPYHASNVDENVIYMHKKYKFTLGPWFDDWLLEAKGTTWVYLQEHWDEAETVRHPILVKAMEESELPNGEGGGLVCF